MNIPLTLGEYKGRSPAANASECINMMAEADINGGTSQFLLTNTPGCKSFVDTTAGKGEGRGGFMYPGYCLAVVGKKLYQIDLSTKTAKSIDNLKTYSGPISFAENPDQILIIDSEYGYVFKKEDATLTQITDEDFPLPAACTFKDGYGVVVHAQTGQFFVSALNDFTTWDALDFATAEFKPDNLVSCVSSGDSLFALGEKTLQVYYNSGNSSFPFDPRVAANTTVGCGAANSVAECQNLAFYVDNSFQVRMIDAYQPKVISTPQIDYRLARLENPENIRGFCYVQDGHLFYTIIHHDLCLVYDVTISQWHRRTSGEFKRHRPGWIAQYGNVVLAGDYTNGKIYQLDGDTYWDNGVETSWQFTLQAVHSDRMLIQHNMLELIADTGDKVTDEPHLWMQYSDDYGKSWSREKWRSLGRTGEAAKRVRWYGLGMSRHRIYRIGGSSNAKRNIIAAKLDGVNIGY